jgi:Golgi phosphoprotein 3 (GPP34)
MSGYPESLPGQLYLLAYDQRRERLTARTQLGYLMRAAALTDLRLRGHIADEGRKVRVTSPGGVADPVLGGVLRELAESRPRSWTRWVRRGARRTRLAVRDQLATGGWIRVEPRRLLGIFPTTRITIRDPLVIQRLTDRLGTALRSADTDPTAAALVALAAAGELRTVLPRAKAREYKQRIAELSERAGPAVPALRRVIQQLRSSAAGG